MEEQVSFCPLDTSERERASECLTCHSGILGCVLRQQGSSAKTGRRNDWRCPLEVPLLSVQMHNAPENVYCPVPAGSTL